MAGGGVGERAAFVARSVRAPHVRESGYLRICARRGAVCMHAEDDLDSFFEPQGGQPEQSAAAPPPQDQSLWPGLRTQRGGRRPDRRSYRGVESSYSDQDRERAGGGTRGPEQSRRRPDYDSRSLHHDNRGRDYDNRSARYDDRRSEFDNRSNSREDYGNRNQQQDTRRSSDYDRRSMDQSNRRSSYDNPRNSYDDSRQKYNSRRPDDTDRSSYGEQRTEYGSRRQDYNPQARGYDKQQYEEFGDQSPRQVRSYRDDTDRYRPRSNRRGGVGYEAPNRQSNYEDGPNYETYRKPHEISGYDQGSYQRESGGDRYESARGRAPGTSSAARSTYNIRQPQAYDRLNPRPDTPSIEDLMAPSQEQIRKNARDMTYRRGSRSGGPGSRRGRPGERPEAIGQDDPEGKPESDASPQTGQENAEEPVPFVRKGLEMMTKHEYEEMEEGGFRMRKDGSFDYDFVLKTPKKREQERMDRLKARRDARKAKRKGKDGRMMIGGGKSGGEITAEGEFIRPEVVERTREAIMRREKGQSGPEVGTSYDASSTEWFVDEADVPNFRVNAKLESIEAQQIGGISDADLNYLPARLRRLGKFPEEFAGFDAWYTELEDILEHADFNDQSLLRVWTALKSFSEVSEMHSRSARSYIQGSAFLKKWSAKADEFVGRYIGPEPVEILSVFAHFSVQPSSSLLGRWYDAMKLVIHRLSPDALVDTIVHFSKLNIRPTQEFVFLWYAAFKKSLVEFTPQNHIDSLYAFGSLRTLPSKEFLLIWYEEAEYSFSKWRPGYFPKSLMSFVKMNLKPNDDFIQQWMAYAEEQFENMSAREISESIHSLALLGLETEEWMDDAWIAAANFKIEYCTNVEIANVIQALGILGLNPGTELLEKCSDGLGSKMGNLNSHAVANVMLAYGALGVSPTQLFRERWFERAETILESFTLDEYFTLVEAMKTAQVKATFEFTDAWCVLCEQRLGKLTLRNLVRGLRGFRELGVEWSDGFGSEWFAAVEKMLGDSDEEMRSELNAAVLDSGLEAPESFHLALASASVGGGSQLDGVTE